MTDDGGPDVRRPAGRGNAGAFLGPGGTFPAQMRTLSDEIPREPTEVEAERRGPGRPGPAPQRLRDRIRRLIHGTRA